jgi:hypothetical protein
MLAKKKIHKKLLCVLVLPVVETTRVTIVRDADRLLVQTERACAMCNEMQCNAVLCKVICTAHDAVR